MSLSKGSIRKLRAVQAAILAEPELYNQNKPGASCGSPCCLAGWAVWNNYPDATRYELARRRADGYIGNRELAEALEISEDQAVLLYEDWPDRTWSPAWRNPGTKEAAVAGANRIDLFINSGGKV